MTSIAPKGYQGDAVNNALEIFRYAENQLHQVVDADSQRAISAFNGCVLLEAPTGAGKTLMAGLIAESFARNDHRDNAKIIWFWFTPFANLVEQAKSALKRDFNGLKIRDLSCERKTYSANSGDVFVTTWASVAARNAETRILRKSGDLSLSLDEFIPELRDAGFRIGVVVDEAHHSFTKATETVNFYRDVMRPEFTLLITATPDHADVEKFKRAAGLAVIHRIQVSRQNAVDAGLIKEAVKSIAYLVPDDQKEIVDLPTTALEDGWRTHQAIKAHLAGANIRLTPLMLVQVGNSGKAGETAIEETKQRLLNLGVSEDAIAWYTADDPNDDLLAVARDESKEVLIFKVAVALGFDAPRAFTLVSLRGANSTDFGIQVVGRILRVHPHLQAMAISKTLPPLLRFGYVFLADAENQGGLIGAGAKINAITTKMSEITPYTMLVKIGNQPEVQVSVNGQLSLLPQPYAIPSWQPAAVAERQTATSLLSKPGDNFSLWEDLLLPQTNQFNNQSTPYPAILKGNTRFPLRDGLPNRFKTERLPLSTDELEKCISARIDLNANVLNAGLRRNLRITRTTIDNIFGQVDAIVDSVQARLSNADIARRAQRVLFDAEYFDPLNLQTRLLERLRSEYNEHRGMDLNDLELARALNLILATYPSLIRNACRECAARFKLLYDSGELPTYIDAPDYINRSRLNVYGLIPQDLNDNERRFAELLDSDTSNTIAWWHRNEPRKPWSVGIIMPDADRYFPDFIVGINNRHAGDGVRLVETKGSHIINSDDTLEKINAEHKSYGKPLMLTSRDDSQFWIMRYIDSTRKIEPDQVFRVENIGHY
ncbi:DNA/RNA helicase [Candidatus Methylobacter favarea]|uniref:DNA/RNA helicase n=1 Tax=Candidatus Methylobacter favarea TaxID=2707345 RepID=A0A8S0WLI2_9GAMM|nr:DEAD/DEAH box helicase family protein [Candidatus Methylobacter favarea]CAA9892640.1 DNA/RNA helicase [Candidatus Methylobacter favarea]